MYSLCLGVLIGRGDIVYVLLGYHLVEEFCLGMTLVKNFLVGH